MKLLHLADLHLGKRVNGFSMLGDQRYILDRILAVADAERPDAVLIAGDVYDRAVPPEEAVRLFDDFLVALAARGAEVFIISGNHDSAERVAFGGRLMDASGIHLAPVFAGAAAPIRRQDEYGPVDLYLLPFIRPAQVRAVWPEEDIATYTDAMRAAIAHLDLDGSARSVAVAHQFVAGAALSDSEELAVGGLDEVDAAVFAPFTYVALGHLHSPQAVGRETLRYAGAPLKYSFSAREKDKSVTVVALGAPGTPPAVREVPLHPLRALREIRGSFDEVTSRAFVAAQPQPREDYYRIVLTDEQDIPNGLARLRDIYPNCMEMQYDNERTRAYAAVAGPGEVERKSPLALFEELYALQNNQPMTPAQRRLTEKLIEEIWGADA